jgi:site-specific recombinase XerC
VQRQASLITSKRAPLVVTALRSFLRYLFHRGIVAVDLATCVPTIATWSLSNVPRFLAGEQIQKILSSCDKETAIGKRDYALLLLLARLGLRAGEVVALALDDFDWEAGLATLRGKGKRMAQMPLPSEERFFTQRLIAQRRVSSHTIASYRDTFRLLLQFVEKRLHKPPSRPALTDLDPSLIGAFLDELEKDRGKWCAKPQSAADCDPILLPIRCV